MVQNTQPPKAVFMKHFQFQAQPNHLSTEIKQLFEPASSIQPKTQSKNTLQKLNCNLAAYVVFSA
jgi:hypothetical protein